jgi:SAM-dependent methyltransferase
MHAPDACLLRLAGYHELDIAGCDAFPEAHFRVFHDFARLRYTQLEHPWLLPYKDESFDTIIGDGVLEHVPNDHESLTELYRVLRPGGCLILCCLPNRWSYTEALARILGRPHHLRTYGLASMRRTLLHHGFRPLKANCYQMAPALTSTGTGPLLNGLARGFWGINGLLEHLWPLNRLGSNLILVAEKCHAIHWTRDLSTIARGAPVRAVLVS